MSVYVVDTSVVVQYLVNEKDTSRVVTLFARCIALTDQVWIPEYCLVECANILWKYVKFQQHSLALANLTVQQLHRLPVEVKPNTALLPRALQIGVAHNLPIYDSMFLALAEELQCPIITNDMQQSKVAQAIGITLKPIADFAAVP